MKRGLQPLALAVAICAACSGGVVASTGELDGSADATVDAVGSSDGSTPDASSDGEDANDGGWPAPPDDAVAWPYADAPGFADYEAPVPGEFPPTEGEPCAHGGGCEPYSGCDEYTGWCCSGQFKSWGCGCGETYGCAAPAVCCSFPDATSNVCVPSADACPTPPP